MLQARKRGASKLCFFNLNFGINEQWVGSYNSQLLTSLALRVMGLHLR